MVYFLYLLLFFLSCSSESEPESNMEREISGLRLSFKGDSTFLVWNSLNSPHKVTHIYIWADNTESLQIDLKEPSESQLNDDDLGLKRWVFAKKDSTLERTEFLIPQDFLESIKDYPKIHFIVWAKFTEGNEGIPQELSFYPSDIFPADRPNVDIVRRPNSLELNFVRPKDMVSQIPGKSQNGVIEGYKLIVSLDSNGDYANQITVNSGGINPLGIYANKDFKFDITTDTFSEFIDVPLESSFKQWAIVDGRSRDSLSQVNSKDSLSITINNLLPQNNYQIQLLAVDVKGNLLSHLDNSPVQGYRINVATTDESQPVMVDDILLTLLENGYGEIRFKASKDPSGIAKYVIEITDSLDIYGVGADSTLQGIGVLGLNRMLVLDSASTESIAQASGFIKDTIPKIFRSFSYVISIKAEDKTGYQSQARLYSHSQEQDDSCPSGYVSMDSTAESNCVAQFEYADESANVLTNVFWTEAVEKCNAIKDTAFDFYLCSESEWSNSCGGGVSRNYGIFKDDISSLLQDCQQFSGDSTQAFSLLQRNIACINEYGVLDIPGQIQEWTTDSLSRDLPAVIKGGNYISSGLNRSQELTLGTCEARAYGSWVRPVIVTIAENEGTKYLLATDALVSEVDSSQRYLIVDSLNFKDMDETFYSLEIYLDSDKKTLPRKDTLDENLKGLFDSNSLYHQDVIASDLTAFKGKRIKDQYKRQIHYKQPYVGFRCCASLKL